MSISTYTELKAAVTNWLHRSDLSNYVDDIIRVGEKWIERNARSSEMETALSVALSSGVAALPADFVELKNVYIDGTPITPLQPKDPNWIYLRYPYRSSDGKPKFIARDGTNFIFGPYPDSNYTLKGIYYKRLDPVATTAHDFFVNNPDLYLFSALAEAEPFLKNDKRIVLWAGKRDQILREINGEDQRARFSGGPLAMVPM